MRQISKELAVGALFGALLALPLPLADLFGSRPVFALEAAGLGPARAMLLAVAPGMVFALGVWAVGIPLNALLWAGSWVVWRSRNPHASARAAKLITALCWGGWGSVAVLVGMLPRTG